MSDKAVITCALNGVLTDPKQHNVPVTPEQMAREARAAFNAGASVMHVHLRQQEPNKGHLPSWDVNVSKEIQQAIREACPGVIINHTTGTSGPKYQVLKRDRIDFYKQRTSESNQRPFGRSGLPD